MKMGWLLLCLFGIITAQQDAIKNYQQLSEKNQEYGIEELKPFWAARGRRSSLPNESTGPGGTLIENDTEESIGKFELPWLSHDNSGKFQVFKMDSGSTVGNEPFRTDPKESHFYFRIPNYTQMSPEDRRIDPYILKSLIGFLQTQPTNKRRALRELERRHDPDVPFYPTRG